MHTTAVLLHVLRNMKSKTYNFGLQNTSREVMGYLVCPPHPLDISRYFSSWIPYDYRYTNKEYPFLHSTGKLKTIKQNEKKKIRVFYQIEVQDNRGLESHTISIHIKHEVYFLSLSIRKILTFYLHNLNICIRNRTMIFDLLARNGWWVYWYVMSVKFIPETVGDTNLQPGGQTWWG
jgi:hypothetical protein